LENGRAEIFRREGADEFRTFEPTITMPSQQTRGGRDSVNQ